MDESRSSNLLPVVLLVFGIAVAAPLGLAVYLLRDSLPGLARDGVRGVLAIGVLLAVGFIVRAWRRGPDQADRVIERHFDGTKQVERYYIGDNISGALQGGFRVDNNPLPKFGVTGGGEYDLLSDSGSTFAAELPPPKESDWS